MKTLGYPTSFQKVSEWSSSNGVPIEEARRRFAQYGILRAIATSHRLRSTFVLKGGNALDFIWHPNRSTIDLDFSADTTIQLQDSPEVWIQTSLQRALNVVGPETGTLYRIHRFKRQPPGEERTFAQLNATRLRQRIEAGDFSNRVIPIEISLNEELCAVTDANIDDSRAIRVCTIEDIVAEKLRALLQQTIRNRVRSQDLLDITVLLRSHLIRAEVVSGYLLRKAKARRVPVSRSAFRDPEVAHRARQDYAALQATVRHSFIEFDEALSDLLAFVDSLDIPD